MDYWESVSQSTIFDKFLIGLEGREYYAEEPIRAIFVVESGLFIISLWNIPNVY